jgi:hypothetical protein
LTVAAAAVDATRCRIIPAAVISVRPARLLRAAAVAAVSPAISTTKFHFDELDGRFKRPFLFGLIVF